MIHDLIFWLCMVIFTAVGFTLWRVEVLREELQQRPEQSSMFSEQLNRRLIEEHTAELKRFNSKKGAS